MSILSKIWAFIKSVFSALQKEPENNVVDVGIPADPNGADDASTEVEPTPAAPAAVDPAPSTEEVQPDPAVASTDSTDTSTKSN